MSKSHYACKCETFQQVGSTLISAKNKMKPPAVKRFPLCCVVMLKPYHWPPISRRTCVLTIGMCVSMIKKILKALLFRSR